MKEDKEEIQTEISATNPEAEATEYVANAIVDDVNLLEQITEPNQFRSILYAAFTLAINNALAEVQTIAFLAKNKEDFYRINRKYIMIIGMYQEIMNEKMKKFTSKQVANHLLIDQQKQLFVIMLSKLFQEIKRADIYFGDVYDYMRFKNMLPIKMYYDNVVVPNMKKNKKKNA